MFFLKQLSRDLLLHPMHFGPRLHDIIRLRLIEEVEGTSMGKYGYVITVTEVRDEDIGRGVIQDNSGYVCFNIKYRAILFRPFKNQVLDAVVTVVNQLGFFADVGPLQVFVSRHAMPTDLNNGYDHENNAWISDDREVEIRKGCAVRLKIMGVSIDVTEIVSICRRNNNNNSMMMIQILMSYPSLLI
jgi:DNA-directed RNA polymerase II subunit RPB7